MENSWAPFTAAFAPPMPGLGMPLTLDKEVNPPPDAPLAQEDSTTPTPPGAAASRVRWTEGELDEVATVWVETMDAADKAGTPHHVAIHQTLVKRHGNIRTVDALRHKMNEMREDFLTRLKEEDPDPTTGQGALPPAPAWYKTLYPQVRKNPTFVPVACDAPNIPVGPPPHGPAPVWLHGGGSGREEVSAYCDLMDEEEWENKEAGSYAAKGKKPKGKRAKQEPVADPVLEEAKEVAGAATMMGTCMQDFLTTFKGYVADQKTVKEAAKVGVKGVKFKAAPDGENSDMEGPPARDAMAAGYGSDYGGLYDPSYVYQRNKKEAATREANVL